MHTALQHANSARTTPIIFPTLVLLVHCRRKHGQRCCKMLCWCSLSRLEEAHCPYRTPCSWSCILPRHWDRPACSSFPRGAHKCRTENLYNDMLACRFRACILLASLFAGCLHRKPGPRSGMFTLVLSYLVRLAFFLGFRAGGSSYWLTALKPLWPASC